MKEIDFLTQIETWFRENQSNFNNKNFWTRNRVAALIKKELLSLNHWKSKPRGNPKLALEWGKYNEDKSNGYDGPPPVKLGKKKSIKQIIKEISPESQIKLSLAKEGWALEEKRLLKKYPTTNPLETKEAQDFAANWQLNKEEFAAVSS